MRYIYTIYIGIWDSGGVSSTLEGFSQAFYAQMGRFRRPFSRILRLFAGRPTCHLGWQRPLRNPRGKHAWGRSLSRFLRPFPGISRETGGFRGLFQAFYAKCAGPRGPALPAGQAPRAKKPGGAPITGFGAKKMCICTEIRGFSTFCAFPEGFSRHFTIFCAAFRWPRPPVTWAGSGR